MGGRPGTAMSPTGARPDHPKRDRKNIMYNAEVMQFKLIPVLLEFQLRKPVQHDLHATGSFVEAAMAGSRAMTKQRAHTCTQVAFQSSLRSWCRYRFEIGPADKLAEGTENHVDCLRTGLARIIPHAPAPTATWDSTNTLLAYVCRSNSLHVYHCDPTHK